MRRAGVLDATLAPGIANLRRVAGQHMTHRILEALFGGGSGWMVVDFIDYGASLLGASISSFHVRARTAHKQGTPVMGPKKDLSEHNQCQYCKRRMHLR